MDSVKRYPVLSAVLAVCVIAFAVESFFLWRFSTQVTTTQRMLKTAKDAEVYLEKASPAPTEENKAAALQNVQDLGAALEKVTKTLSDTPVKITDIPVKQTDLQVAIQGFVTNLQAKAKDKDIILPGPDFAFGMSMYIGRVSPPPVDKIPAVFTQMKVLDYILGHLMGDAKLDGQKMMITSVMRENVAAASATPGSPVATSAVSEPNVTDVFVIPPTITARGPGLDTLAFQIQFIGYTESLRLLLNDLKNFEMPLVVRSIEVTHADQSTLEAAVSGGNAPSPSVADRTKPKAAGNTRKAVVDENLSQFTFIVEYVQLPAPPAPAVPSDGAAAPTASASTSSK